MVHCAVLLEQFGCAVADVVWMGEPEVDEERVIVVCPLPAIEVIDHSVAVPLASGFRCSAPLGSILADGEQFVG